MKKELLIEVSNLKWLQFECEHCHSKALVDAKNVSISEKCFVCGEEFSEKFRVLIETYKEFLKRAQEVQELESQALCFRLEITPDLYD